MSAGESRKRVASLALPGWAVQTWDGPLGYEVRDLEIVSGDGVAFSHSVNHVTGTQRGEKKDLWFRSTLGFRKVGGKWKIALAPREFFHKPATRLFVFCRDPLNAVPRHIEAVLSNERSIIDPVEHLQGLCARCGARCR